MSALLFLAVLVRLGYSMSRSSWLVENCFPDMAPESTIDSLPSFCWLELEMMLLWWELEMMLLLPMDSFNMVI